MSTQKQSQRAKITKNLVDNLKPPQSGQIIIRDNDLKGFGVRVTANASKAFILEKRVKGRVRRQTLGRYPELTVETARKQALIALGQIAQGQDPLAEKQLEKYRGVTLVEAFEDYKAARKNLSDKTIYDYTRYLATSLKGWTNKRLIDITKDMVAKNHTHIGNTSGPTHANHVMRFLRAIFNFAKVHYENDNGISIITDNPVDRLTHTRAWYEQKRRRDVLRPHQFPTLFQAIEELRSTELYDATLDYILLLLFTGMRRKEGMKLLWENIDFYGRTLTVPNTKNKEPLILPLTDFLIELLERRYEKRENEYVFHGTGKAGHLVEPKKTIDKVRELSGIDFKLHDLRRTFITIADSLDLSYYAIKHLINHKTAGDVTAGYIIHDVERLREPMQRISNFILDAVNTAENKNVIPLVQNAS